MGNTFEQFKPPVAGSSETSRDEKKREVVIETYKRKAEQLDLGAMYPVDPSALPQLQEAEVIVYVREAKPYLKKNNERAHVAEQDDLENPQGKEFFIKDPERDQALLGEWLDADGMEYGGNSSGRWPTNTESREVIQDRLKDVGKWSYNGGVLAFVNEKGEMKFAPSTKRLFKRLEDMNYQHGSFWVPLSHGEVPVNPVQREKWLRMREGAEKSKKH